MTRTAARTRKTKEIQQAINARLHALVNDLSTEQAAEEPNENTRRQSSNRSIGTFGG